VTVAPGAALVAAAYLLGSVPFGVLVARLAAGVDPRTVGSGNIGASNVTRSAGKVAGAITLALDAARRRCPLLAWALLRLGEPWRRRELVGGHRPAAFGGHLWPVCPLPRRRRRHCPGVFLVLAPMPALLALAAFALAFGATRIAAVGSLAGVAVAAIGTFMVHGFASLVPWAGLAVATLIVWRHRGNIRRLVEGSENKV
jgi:glycerol-3-phosphate acyltransferase PlsY